MNVKYPFIALSEGAGIAHDEREFAVQWVLWIFGALAFHSAHAAYVHRTRFGALQRGPPETTTGQCAFALDKTAFSFSVITHIFFFYKKLKLKFFK